MLCLAGFALIAVDIFFIPGGSIGFLGFAMMVFACYMAYNSLGNTEGHLFVAFTTLSSAAFLYYIFRPDSWKRVSVHDEISGKVNTDDTSRVRVGDSGRTLSVLRPSGSALFGEYVAEVTTRQPMIANDTAIRVVEIDDNKIYVETL